MNPEVFDFSSMKIAYRRDHSARRVDWPPVAAQLEDASCIFGMWDISDEASVHADQWERHPAGDETLLVLEGALRIHFDEGAGSSPTLIPAGKAFIVPAGQWHRLEVVAPGKLVTFTPVAGGESRPVNSADAHDVA